MTKRWSDLTEAERRRVLGRPGLPQSSAINGARVKMARELLGWSVDGLAERLGTGSDIVQMVEDGGFQPSAAMQEALVCCLGFPLAFFTKDAPPAFPLGTLLLHGLGAQVLCDICDGIVDVPAQCSACGKDICAACQEVREGSLLCLECAAKAGEATLRISQYWSASPEAQGRMWSASQRRRKKG